jgi:serine/threonine protein kinase
VACRDVIKSLRSLYQVGKILHPDVSKNNVIITDAENEGDSRGVVIDLDLAKELESSPSGARHRTGTMEFMAIEVLEGKAHTYRHDLESFFYVFLWVIIRYGGETGKNLPETSRLRDWYKETYQQIATIKEAHMGKKRFKNITAEFPPQFEDIKPLAEELRHVLFPIRDESLFIGTYSDHKGINSMYDGMTNAFDRTIETHRQKVEG